MKDPVVGVALEIALEIVQGIRFGQAEDGEIYGILLQHPLGRDIVGVTELLFDNTDLAPHGSQYLYISVCVRDHAPRM